MTFVRKFSGDRTAPIIAVYTCPEHGEFDCEVQRDDNGEAPDEIECPAEVSDEAARSHAHGIMNGIWSHSKPTTPTPSFEELFVFCKSCRNPATWTPSATVGCRVRRVEVTRGKWEKPERKTYLDTRKLGEGQDPAEFQAERKKMWREKRLREIKDL